MCHFIANPSRVNFKTVPLKTGTRHSFSLYPCVFCVLTSSFIMSHLPFVCGWSVQCKPQEQTGVVAPKFSGAVGQVRPALVSSLCVDPFLVYLQFIAADSCTSCKPTDCSKSYFTYLLILQNTSQWIFVISLSIFKELGKYFENPPPLQRVVHTVTSTANTMSLLFFFLGFGPIFYVSNTKETYYEASKCVLYQS